MPAITSSLLVYFNILLSLQILPPLITAFSIFIAFGFNTLTTITFEGKSSKASNEYERLKKKFFEHFIYTTLYFLIVGICTVILLILTIILYNTSVIIVKILSWFVYFALVNFLFTLFVIAKRLYTVVRLRIEGR
ncbi:MAG: hypothetical protein ACTSR0_06380 [Candidatus Asgardarchaeia archaeon]